MPSTPRLALEQQKWHTASVVIPSHQPGRQTQPPPPCDGGGGKPIVRGGHPWVFAQSVRAQNRDGETGELAVIFDRKDQFLAVGLFDPDSPIRVRILHAGKPQAIKPGLLA